MESTAKGNLENGTSNGGSQAAIMRVLGAGSTGQMTREESAE